MKWRRSKRATLKIVRNALSVATLVALTFIIIQFHKQWPAISHWKFSTGDVLLVVALSVLYGMSLLLLAHLWFCVLIRIEPDNIDRRTAYGIYARVQIAKYIPGNVFQFAGRHVYLTSYNFAHGSILKATFTEISLMLLSALGVALFFFPYNAFEQLNSSHLLGFSSLALVSVLLAALSIFHFFRHKISDLRSFLALAGWPLLFFILQSAIFATLGSMLGWELSGLLMFTAAISWTVGFVVPGAPGGVGMRELVIYTLLYGVHPQSEVLVLLAAFRCTTILGDVLFFLWGTRIKLVSHTEKS